MCKKLQLQLLRGLCSPDPPTGALPLDPTEDRFRLPDLLIDQCLF